MNLDERNNYPDRTEFDLSVMGFLPLQEIGHLNQCKLLDCGKQSKM